jgi:hypothetical protein
MAFGKGEMGGAGSENGHDALTDFALFFTSRSFTSCSLTTGCGVPSRGGTGRADAEARELLREQRVLLGLTTAAIQLTERHDAQFPLEAGCRLLQNVVTEDGRGGSRPEAPRVRERGLCMTWVGPSTSKATQSPLTRVMTTSGSETFGAAVAVSVVSVVSSYDYETRWILTGSTRYQK